MDIKDSVFSNQSLKMVPPMRQTIQITGSGKYAEKSRKLQNKMAA